MRKLYLLFTLLLLIVITCDEEPPEEELDTTPPIVSVSSHYSSQIVFEIVSIIVLTQDNVGIEKVEFFINDSLVFTDFESPYQYDWDTTPYEEESENIIKVISYDVSGNSTQSQPIMLLVKNELGKPSPSNISSIVFQNGYFSINWNSSNSEDFFSYHLEKSSDSLMNDYQIIHSSQDVMDTSFIDSDINPLVYQYYRVTTTDTLGLETKGEIFSSSLDEIPNSVNITSVEYTFDEMTINWEESTDGDFKQYKLLYSETENGLRDTLSIISEKQTTSYNLVEFDPLHENWFWVEVSDTLGQTSIGTGTTNEIESPPTPSELYPITYNDGFQISWSQNNDDDFVSYKLYESFSEDMSNDTLIYETEDRTDTTYFKTILNYMYYKIVVEDVWGLQSTSNIEVGDYLVELWGEFYSVENTIELNLGYNQLTGEIPSEIGNLTNLRRLYLYNNQLSGPIPPEIGNLTNLERLSLNVNELTGEIPSEIGNLIHLNTRLDLSYNQLTGSIPPEIGNLTNLRRLWLHHNQLTGSIPSEISNLNLLNYLELTDNQLTGSIPSEIGNLTNLIGLKLENNQLTGSIPSEIGNLTNLTNLWLRYNQLTGEIPESICDLNISWWSSTYFRISNNQLCPPYPSCVEDYVGEQDTSDCP